VWVFHGGDTAVFVYVLLAFLFFVMAVFLCFPGTYKFWKNYLLKARATENKLRALKWLDRLHTIYCEVESVVRGRGGILYFMSLLAWGVEIGNLSIFNGVGEPDGISQRVVNYLTSAISGGKSPELQRFAIVSVALLMVAYLFIKAGERMTRKEERK
jgi:hypothetical protein